MTRKRLAYLQYAQSTTVHVTQLAIPNSCQTKKKNLKPGSVVAIRSWWCIARQFFEVGPMMVRLGAFFGKRNGRASLR